MTRKNRFLVDVDGATFSKQPGREVDRVIRGTSYDYVSPYLDATDVQYHMEDGDSPEGGFRAFLNPRRKLPR